MNDTSTTTVFPRPRHVFDVPRAAAFTLALVGTASLRLAQAIDAAEPARRRVESRPRARIGPAERFDLNHRAGESWRIK